LDIPNFYHGDYRKLAVVPLAIILIALYFIPHIQLGVDFKGGMLVTLKTNHSIDSDALAAQLTANGIEGATIKQYALPIGNEVEIEVELDPTVSKADALKTDFFNKVDDVSRLEADSNVQASNTTSAADVQAAKEKYTAARAQLDAIANQVFDIAGSNTRAELYPNTDSLRKLVSDANVKIADGYKNRLTNAISKVADYDSISIQSISATLSAQFIDHAITVVIISAIFTAIVVFFIFRDFTPSIAVMIGAASDVLIAMGAMGLFGIPMTLASFAALMVLIGYSLDTDILLTTRVLKRSEGHAADRAYDSMKTGMTMSVTAFIAFAVLFVLSVLTNINTYYEISAVALAGLVGDIFATWGINAVIILWHAEEIEKKRGEIEKKGLSTIYK